MEKPKPFRFKQFAVYQDRCAMKVGTDGVLLGAWTKTNNSKQILDIGCGTGLLALMLAQKSSAKITAIEIDEAASQQASENIAASPWADRISVIKQDFNEFYQNHSEKFDLIISNPPYFNAKQNRNPREQARQNISLPYESLIKGAAKLLSQTGKLNLVLPYSEKGNIEEILDRESLFINRLTKVKGNATAETKRLLLEISLKAKPQEESEIIIEQTRHEYTAEYQNLLKDYLLIF